MRAIIIFLCALSVYGCVDVAKSKQIYQTQDTGLQFILNSISERLDKLEGLRGTTTVLFPWLVRAEFSGKNANNTTLPSLGNDFLKIDCGIVTKGEFIYVEAQFLATKGVTAGILIIGVGQSFLGNDSLGTGAAEVVVRHDLSGLGIVSVDAASTDVSMQTSGMMRVVKSGKLILALRGTSAGSDATVFAGNGQMYIAILRGT